MTSNTKRITVFTSKHDHCLKNLLESNKNGELGGVISLVISNHADCEEIAMDYDIPFHFTSIQASNQKNVEADQIKLIKDNNIDLVVLARYMQILSPEFVNTFKNKIINIHHSLLPAFPGANPYQQAFDRGVKFIGATAHYVTSDLDQGPIIDQDNIRINCEDSALDLKEKGKAVESAVLNRAVQLHLQDRILMNGNKCIILAKPKQKLEVVSTINDWATAEWPMSVLAESLPEVYGSKITSLSVS